MTYRDHNAIIEEPDLMQDLALKAFLKTEDPAASIDPLRLARIEAILFERLADSPQIRPVKRTLPFLFRSKAQDRHSLWRVFSSSTSRFAASALLCLLLGLWIGMEGRLATQQGHQVSAAASSHVVATADTGVSANLPLLAMASPWQEWVSTGEER